MKTRLAHPLDTKYKELIKRARALPWDKKPEKTVQSALHELFGTINGKSVGFGWHQPHVKWGDDWAFIGLLVDYKTVLESNWQELETNEFGPNMPAMFKKNIEAFEKALEIAAKL